MMIGKHDLDKDVLVIAEIGNNHEGDHATALRMVERAAEAGVHAVKIQVIDPERLVNISQQNRIVQLTKFRLPWPVIEEMSGLAHRKGMLFIASAFDVGSLERVAPLVDAIKIASGDLDFGLLLRSAARLGKPLILSTGMSNLDEIRRSVDIISTGLPANLNLVDMLVLLHCVSLYPTPFSKANLRVIQTLQRQFGLTVGYSDHTLGIEAAVLSLMLGARMIEKHFTLDKGRTSFRDHALSADAGELQRLVEVARGLEDMLGVGEKVISSEEQAVAAAARRSIVASRDLPANALLSADDLDYVRPRDGLAPELADRIVGRRLLSALKRHDVISESNFV